jgi:hypothetical protein
MKSILTFCAEEVLNFETNKMTFNKNCDLLKSIISVRDRHCDYSPWVSKYLAMPVLSGMQLDGI